MNDACCPPNMNQSPRSVGRLSPNRARAGLDRRRLSVLLVALITVTSTLAVAWLAAGFSAGPGAHSAPLGVPTAARSPSAAATVAARVSASAAPILPPAPHPHASASGPGTFFTSVAIPNPSPGNQTCPISYFCWNNTDNPSANLTTAGYTGMAYTAYTNASPCPGMRGNSTVPDASTEVGWVVSTDFGNTWSSPVYLGNPSCTGADANYSSAMDPSLTSLGNGTFALAYVEYNYTTQSTYSYLAPPFGLDCYDLEYDRVVVTFSYDNGATWSTPTVINGTVNSGCATAGFPDLRPSITATGDSIYLAWENVSSPFDFYCCTTMFGSVNIVASTDGGSTWSSPVTVPQVVGSYFGTGTSLAMNPVLMVDNVGNVYVAYATGLTYNYVCSVTCGYQQDASIYVGTSSNNASSFTYVDVSDGQYLNEVSYYPSVYLDPAPILAFDSVSGQAYVGWAGGLAGSFCDNEGIYGRYCGYSGYTVETIYLSNSSNGGANWSTPRDVVPTTLINPNGGDLSYAYNPSIAVDSSGRVHLQYTYENNSDCQTVAPYGYNTSFCAPIFQMYQNSSDLGYNWTQPAQVYPNVSWFCCAGHDFYSGTWPGTYSSLVTAGSQVLLAWVTEQCPGWSLGTYCEGYYGNGYSEVVTSRLFEGAGITVTFTETGAPTGVNWTASLMGNVRVGPTGSSLSVSGVPSGAWMQFEVPWLNISYGVAYNDTLSTTSPTTFTASTTISASFTEIVLLNIQSIPYVQSYQWQYKYVNYDMSPRPTSEWISVGTSVSMSVIASGFASPCYYCLNLSFSAWTGTGNGSVNSKALSVTVTPTSQVNETANFQLLGICNIATYYGSGCLNFTYLTTFVESGLPAGTEWGVTLVNTSNGIATEYETNATNMSVGVGGAPVYYYLWTVPSSTSGEVWIPSTTATDPIVIPQTTAVDILYTLGAPSGASFPTIFTASGLPNGTAWSLEVGGSSYGVTANSTTLSLTGDTSFSVNGSFVYLPNGTGYYAASVNVTPYVANETASNSPAPATVLLNGSGEVTVNYRPMYYVTVAASVGGSVGPANQWVDLGGSVALSETPASGYHFVGWSGTGSGQYTGGNATPTVRPTGAVSEFATFRPDSPPTWNLTLTEAGLPAGTSFSVTIGGTTYTGAGSFRVPDLPNGTVSVSAALLYLNATQTTRFVPTDLSSSLTLANGLLDLVANGTLTVSYETQYAVSIQTTPGGTITPAEGLYWFNGSSSLALSATPAAGYYFGGWNGTGNGSFTSGATSGSAVVNSPLTETAVFVLRPPAPPATYWLAVTETGLPGTVEWNVSAGGFGATGTNGTLTIYGLNGSYTLSVPAIYVGAGDRWVATPANASETVTSNGTFSVSFVQQYLVTVVAGPGGTATPASSWVVAGSVVDLTATANATSQFVNWTGTGSGSYTGTAASTSLTVNGPVTEEATFQPVAPKTGPSGGQTGASPLMAIVLLVVLLVVGAIIGLLVGRRRGASPPPPTPYSVEGGEAPSIEEPPTEGGATAWSEDPAETP